mmetsp:Transcript_22087/g.65455  ORF Transcript_22087/g.65455 Transcript_22087/m.65455 type:complete len:227 (+) Transcript_22087:1090-1770(+)
MPMKRKKRRMTGRKREETHAPTCLILPRPTQTVLAQRKTQTTLATVHRRWCRRRCRRSPASLRACRTRHKTASLHMTSPPPMWARPSSSYRPTPSSPPSPAPPVSTSSTSAIGLLSSWSYATSPRICWGRTTWDSGGCLAMSTTTLRCPLLNPTTPTPRPHEPRRPPPLRPTFSSMPRLPSRACTLWSHSFRSSRWASSSSMRPCGSPPARRTTPSPLSYGTAPQP